MKAFGRAPASVVASDAVPLRKVPSPAPHLVWPTTSRLTSNLSPTLPSPSPTMTTHEPPDPYPLLSPVSCEDVNDDDDDDDDDDDCESDDDYMYM